ncbi:MAG: CPBP family intramembrane metalloprotease [Actinomycetota bacterium]|nr:CPBP family intramembrane metalloprotease [Actinomycetota bacterium]
MTVQGDRRSAVLRRAVPSAVLLAGFAAALALRVALGGPGVARSAPAGLAFAGCLGVLTLAAGTRLRLGRRAAWAGLLAGAVLCLPPLLTRVVTGWTPRPDGSYLGWAAVVAVVAIAEEAFLRGALYDAVAAWQGEVVAIGTGALAFAVLHVPLYGWHVAMLDLAVGIWLGVLRSLTGSPGAPAVAHVVADLAGWWVR